jgi:hypothetical protein
MTKKQTETTPLVEASDEAMQIITKASLRVYTVGGNKLYTFLKHARSYVRNQAKDRSPKRSAEDLNAAFDSVFAEV